MTDFWQRLKQRKLVQWAVAYVAAAFALLQGVDIVAQQFGWPGGLQRGITLALVLGFCVALVLAWYHGERNQQKISNIEVLILTLLLAVGGGVLWRYARVSPDAPATSTASPTPAVDAARPVVSATSIAVLPFVSMSSDKDNEFFSDGLSEEILNSLARIEGMQVVGRTSSFQFKGKNEDLRTIGMKLDVATVLEGSVRREGERARITAQLIRTSDGIHLWSETYDRTVSDTLAVQLDIAEKVAGALNVILDEKQRTRMRESGVQNVDAFVAYQKGLKLYNDAHARADLDFFSTMALANDQFAKAIALEPDFSLAHYMMADRFEHLLQDDQLAQGERIDAQRMALKTLEMAAANTKDTQQRLLTLAERQMLSDDWRGLASRIGAAFREPGCNASNWLPVFASAFGYGDEIESFGARATACDPLNFININTRMTVALATGHAERVLAIVQSTRKARGEASYQTSGEAVALAMLGRIDEAAALLDNMGPDKRQESYAEALAIVGHARGQDPAEIHEELKDLDRTSSKYRQWQIAEMVEAAHAGNKGEVNRLSAILDARPAGGLLLAIFVGACQCGAPFDLDATPNFKARLAESGLRWPPPQAINFPPREKTTTP